MFNLPDPMPFYKIVWEIVRQVPASTVTTFGQIATMIPTPKASRMTITPSWVLAGLAMR